MKNKIKYQEWDYKLLCNDHKSCINKKLDGQQTLILSVEHAMNIGRNNLVKDKYNNIKELVLKEQLSQEKRLNKYVVGVAHNYELHQMDIYTFLLKVIGRRNIYKIFT